MGSFSGSVPRLQNFFCSDNSSETEQTPEAPSEAIAVESAVIPWDQLSPQDTESYPEATSLATSGSNDEDIS